MKIDIKGIVSDKKNRVIIGLSFLSFVLLCVILYPMFFSCKRGYMNEWYGSNKIVDRGILKSHKTRMDELKQKMKVVLSSENVNVDDLRSIFKEFANERAQFNTIIENNMIDKIVKMSQKKRNSFASKMFMENDKVKSHKASKEKRSHGRKSKMMDAKKDMKKAVIKKARKSIKEKH